MLTFVGAQLLPAVLIFASLLATAVLVDLGLHAAELAWVGRWLGPVGVALLALSFLHSMRRRKLIQLGSPKALLQIHETLGWLGALVLLVHGGIHFSAVIPWAAVGAMVLVVASGLTGKYLLAEARKGLASRRKELEAIDIDPREVERRLQILALLTGAMQRWRRIHMPLTMLFFGLALVHVFATLLLW
jgi:hypothetical protein